MTLMFKFISGKYKGGEFPLDKDLIVIGRHSELEMVLSEDMVSRKHAKMIISGNNIILQDMGSTNGTFVNGNRIKKVKLKLNDRILIGTSIAKLINSDDTGQNMEDAAKSGTNAVSGSIEDIPIPEVLQLLVTSKKTGVLKITSGNLFAEVQLIQGIFNDVIIPNNDTPPKKILFKLIKLSSGHFEFEQKDSSGFGNRLNITLDSFLLEAAKYEDEVGLDEIDLETDDDLILDDFDEVDDASDDIFNLDGDDGDDDVFNLDDLDDGSDDIFDLDDFDDEPKKPSPKIPKTPEIEEDSFNLDDLDDDDDFNLDDFDDEPKEKPKKPTPKTPEVEEDSFSLDDLDDDDDFNLDDFDDEPKDEPKNSTPKTPEVEEDSFSLDDLDDNDDFNLDNDNGDFNLDDFDEPKEEAKKIEEDSFNLDDLDDDDDFSLDDFDEEPKETTKEKSTEIPKEDGFSLDDLDDDDDFNLDDLDDEPKEEIKENLQEKAQETPKEEILEENIEEPAFDESTVDLAKLKELFPNDAMYVLPLPLFSPLDELSKNELKVLQLVHNFGSVSEITENTELSEKETYSILEKLLEEDYIEQ